MTNERGALTDERILKIARTGRHPKPWGFGSRPEDAIKFARGIEAEVRAALAQQPPAVAAEPALTYGSTQATTCAGCGERKHTPLRIDAMGGYVCLTCIDSKLGSLLGEFGYPEPAQPATQAGAGETGSHPLVRAYEAAAHCLDYAGNNEDHREASQALRRARDALNAALATTQPPQGAEPSRDAERLERIRSAIDGYHLALDTRQHGGVAMDRAFNTITEVMEMPWVRGPAARAAHGKGGQG